MQERFTAAVLLAALTIVVVTPSPLPAYLVELDGQGAALKVVRVIASRY